MEIQRTQNNPNKFEKYERQSLCYLISSLTESYSKQDSTAFGIRIDKLNNGTEQSPERNLKLRGHTDSL